MAKFVFIVPPLDGHVNPTLSVGKGLLERGHEVAWISLDPFLEKKLPKKGKLLLIPHNYSDEELKELMLELQEKQKYGIESLKVLYEEVLVPLNQFMLDGIVGYLNKFKPDVVIYDLQVFAGAVAAIKLNLPYVASVTAPSSIKAFDALPKLHEWESNQIIDFQKRNGIEIDTRLENTAPLVLVYTSKLFFGEKELPSSYKFIGPMLSERKQDFKFDWKRFNSNSNHPRLLVTIGTTFNFEEKKLFFKKITEALKDEDLTAVIISDPKIFDEIPENFIVQPRVPQLELLPHLQLVICHGGQNTVSETLSWGIPLIILPIAYDQSQVANSVTLLDAGIRLNFNRFKPAVLKESVNELLQDKKYAENAKKIQDSFHEAGGVSKAIYYLEELLHNSH